MKEKINGTQRALRILKALKGRTMDGLSNKELCEAIDETPVNITRATALLESEGFFAEIAHRQLDAQFCPAQPCGVL